MTKQLILEAFCSRDRPVLQSGYLAQWPEERTLKDNALAVVKPAVRGFWR